MLMNVHMIMKRHRFLKKKRTKPEPLLVGQMQIGNILVGGRPRKEEYLKKLCHYLSSTGLSPLGRTSYLETHLIAIQHPLTSPDAY